MYTASDEVVASESLFSKVALGATLYTKKLTHPLSDVLADPVFFMVKALMVWIILRK